MNDVANVWIWFGFSIFIITALSVDAFLLDKKYARPHQSMRAAFAWTMIWVASALLFNGLLWVYLYLTTNIGIANEKALVFLTGYVIEKSLALDNLFVFYIIFKQLQIPIALQQRVFSYGIWSAIVMRLVLILLGTWLISHFHWILYLMGAFLFLTGIKMLIVKEKEKNLADTFIIQCIKRFFRLTPELHGNQFFIKQNNLSYATPLFVALVFIELGDLIFAIDSIPAIFAITQDPFIVWSSNIFAILGLRAMYFMLSGMLLRFYLLKYGIALILVFVGCKMLIEPWISISVAFSLGVIAGILLIFIMINLIQQRRQQGRQQGS